MNDQDPEVLAAAYTPPPFPTWPPPSGGAPVLAPELGPITNPFPYGSAQTPNIATAPPAPLKKATYFPTKMPAGANGQNQNQKLPTWPKARFNVLPDKANPIISQISPPPIMGPANQTAQMARWEDGPDISGSQAKPMFPAGKLIGSGGTTINPTTYTKTLGGL